MTKVTKGASWSTHNLAELRWHEDHPWVAAFADEDEALLYAWTRPGCVVRAFEIMLGLPRYNVYQRRPRTSSSLKGVASRA